MGKATATVTVKKTTLASGGLPVTGPVTRGRAMKEALAPIDEADYTLVSPAKDVQAGGGDVLLKVMSLKPEVGGAWPSYKRDWWQWKLGCKLWRLSTMHASMSWVR